MNKYLFILIFTFLNVYGKSNSIELQAECFGYNFTDSVSKIIPSAYGQHNNPGIKIGINNKYKITNQYYLQTGLLFSYFSFNAERSYLELEKLTDSTNILKGIMDENISSSLGYIEVPLAIEYLFTKISIHPSVTFGGSINYCCLHEINYHIINNNIFNTKYSNIYLYLPDSSFDSTGSPSVVPLSISINTGLRFKINESNSFGLTIGTTVSDLFNNVKSYLYYLSISYSLVIFHW